MCITDFFIYLNQNQFWDALLTHVELSSLALLVSIVVCVPLGVVCAKKYIFSVVMMNIVNTLRVVPSLAVLVVLIPIMGTGFWPAVTALTILACPPVLINTYIGFHEIDGAIIESAIGMGMNVRQVMTRVEAPLALGLVLTGVKTASVEVVASATLAAFIGAGGLGTFIINGLGMFDFHMLMLGAIPVAIMAIMVEIGMGILERSFYKMSGVDEQENSMNLLAEI